MKKLSDMTNKELIDHYEKYWFNDNRCNDGIDLRYMLKQVIKHCKK